MTRARRPKQTELRFPNTWGGKRKGAGRKRTGPRRLVAHTRRPRHVGRHPLLVTVRTVPGAGNLRVRKVVRALWKAFDRGKERFGFRLIEYSIQRDHLHLLVEAEDAKALARGMQGLGIRIARAINRVRNRRGRVFSDRYHARALTTPLEVHRALRYTLSNGRKHARQRGETWSPRVVDVYSSAIHFRGWSREVSVWGNLPVPQVTAEPATWLLRIGWRKHHGTIDPAHVPST